MKIRGVGPRRVCKLCVRETDGTGHKIELRLYTSKSGKDIAFFFLPNMCAREV